MIKKYMGLLAQGPLRSMFRAKIRINVYPCKSQVSTLHGDVGMMTLQIQSRSIGVDAWNVYNFEEFYFVVVFCLKYAKSTYFKFLVQIFIDFVPLTSITTVHPIRDNLTGHNLHEENTKIMKGNFQVHALKYIFQFILAAAAYLRKFQGNPLVNLW